MLCELILRKMLFAGITDKPECKAREDVMDVTLRGPTAGLEDIYGKYTSLYYPNSFLNVIRNTYPAISTGVIREFRAIEGEFRDGASLEETLDGDVNVAMLVYKNADAALQLFGGEPSPEAQKILGAGLQILFVHFHEITNIHFYSSASCSCHQRRLQGAAGAAGEPGLGCQPGGQTPHQPH